MCLKTRLDHLKLQKLFMCSCAQMSVGFPRCSLKLYMVPINPFYRRSHARSCAWGGSSEMRCKHHEILATSGVFGPNSSKRYRLI